jgi:hypothetical protein
MYVVSVVLLMLVLPLVSIAIELSMGSHGGAVFVVGRWFVFWGAGVRLFIAGIRQVVQPSFTAGLLGVKDSSALVVVRELGLANISMGLLSICSLFRAEWVVPGAIVGGLYYGLAGAGHVVHKDRSAHENLAMFSDLGIFVLLAVFVVMSLRGA